MSALPIAVTCGDPAGVGYDFPGQTEFFASRWNGEPVMAGWRC